MSEINVDARLVGIIGKPHGIKGEIVMMLLTDYPKTIKKGDIFFFDEKCSQKAEVENIKWKRLRNSNIPVIKFKGIDDRNGAENLKGKSIFRSVKDSPILKNNQYWIDDITGCTVYTKDNSIIGMVMDVERFAANDNLVIKVENKNLNIECTDNDTFYIPVIEDYIDSIDLKKKKIILKKIPEYL